MATTKAAKILVTTPGGKVGSEVAKLLLAKGIAVRIGAHSVEAARKAFPGAEVVPLDLESEASVREALAGISAVYLASPGDWPAAPEKRLIDLAKAAGVKRIVKLSAIGVEAAGADVPIRQVEQHLEASGLEFTILRPSWFMQNFTTSMAASIKSGILAEPAAEAKTAFIDARDIAAVAAVALTADGHAGKAYTLTGPALLDRVQVAATISKTLGREVKYLAVSDDQFRAAVKAHLSPAYLEVMSALYAGVRAGWTEKKTDAVREILGREPIAFERFAQEHKQAWQ